MRDGLAALVAAASENPPGTNYAPCVDLLCSMLAAADVPYECIDVPTLDGTPKTAIRAWVGEGPEALTFRGHYDVVPATRPSQFTPRVEGDALFGRGSSDMKGGLVAMLHAAVALRTIGVPLRGRIELLFVPAAAGCRHRSDGGVTRTLQ